MQQLPAHHSSTLSYVMAHLCRISQLQHARGTNEPPMLLIQILCHTLLRPPWERVMWVPRTYWITICFINRICDCQVAWWRNVSSNEWAQYSVVFSVTCILPSTLSADFWNLGTTFSLLSVFDLQIKFISVLLRFLFAFLQFQVKDRTISVNIFSYYSTYFIHTCQSKWIIFLLTIKIEIQLVLSIK